MTVNQASGPGTTAGRIIMSLEDGYGVVLDTIFPLPLVHELEPRPQGRRQVRAWLRDKRREEDGQEHRLHLIRCLHRGKIW